MLVCLRVNYACVLLLDFCILGLAGTDIDVLMCSDCWLVGCGCMNVTNAAAGCCPILMPMVMAAAPIILVKFQQRNGVYVDTVCC